MSLMSLSIGMYEYVGLKVKKEQYQMGSLKMILHKLESSDHIPTEQSLLKIENKTMAAIDVFNSLLPGPFRGAQALSDTVCSFYWIDCFKF